MAISNQTFINRYTVIVGLNDKDTRKPIYGDITEIREIETVIKKLIREALKDYRGGYSAVAQRGGYRHIDGEFIEEQSLSLVFYDVSEKTINGIAESLCKVFNQESILIEKDKVIQHSYRAQ